MPTLRSTFELQPNGLNAARHIFATVVVFSHAFEVGNYGLDPLKVPTGLTTGDLGVAFFFAVSGFLLARSWSRNPNWKIFLWHRFLRIFPAFWVCLGLCGLVLYPLWVLLQEDSFNSVNWDQALGYITSNALLRIRQPGIGGMFSGHPADGVINGSLWSLFPEFLCYLLVLVLGAAGTLRQRLGPALAFGFILLALGMSLTPVALRSHTGTSLFPPLFYIGKLLYVSSFFAGGILLFVFADKAPISWWTWTGCFTAFAMILFTPSPITRAFLPVAVPYLAISGSCLMPFNRFDGIGDFSYGIYIYHYPIQQIMYGSHLFEESSVGIFALSSWVYTCVLACFSWFGVERIALRIRHRFDR
ncbi:MAG: acyltransferase family protein [Prochlorococcaceae cyanobacterium]